MFKQNQDMFKTFIGATLVMAYCSVAFSSNVHASDEEKLQAKPEKEVIIVDPGRQKARSSRELYVDPDFEFSSHSTYTVDVSVQNSQQQPVTGVLLRVYRAADGEEVDINAQLEDDALLTIMRTTDNGWANRTIEFPQDIENILILAEYVGIENRKAVKLGGEAHIVVNF